MSMSMMGMMPPQGPGEPDADDRAGPPPLPQRTDDKKGDPRALNALGHAKHRKVSGKNPKQVKPPYNHEHPMGKK